MEVQNTILKLNSTDPRRLYEFYRETVGLKVLEDIGEFSLDAAGTWLMFDTHSEVNGGAREPQRHLLDFMVADIDPEHERLIAAGVPCIRDRGLEYWGGIISTFVDPDGNYIQLIEYDPSKAQPMPEAVGQTA